MATVNKSEIIQKLIKGLRLDPGKDKIPTEIASKIIPVYNTEEDGEVIAVGTSSADNECIMTVPEGYEWELLYGMVKFTTSATVGNRTIRFKIKDEEGNLLWIVSAAGSQVASSTEYYNMSLVGNAPTETVAARHFIPCPGKSILKEGWEFEYDDINAVSGSDDFQGWFVVRQKSKGA